MELLQSPLKTSRPAESVRRNTTKVEGCRSGNKNTPDLLPPQQSASESCAVEALVSAPVCCRRRLEEILLHPCSMKQENFGILRVCSGKVCNAWIPVPIHLYYSNVFT